MFTGLIEEIGKVRSITRTGQNERLTITAAKVLAGANLGDSIAVNGICLTVVELGANAISADVMPETLRRSSLDRLRANSPVNLERALRLGDRLGGHLVSGHIDGTGILLSRQMEENAIILRIKPPIDLLRYIVKKGSITLDGVSLTVMAVDEQSFAVSIIPHSAEVTIIGNYKTGDRINIECDLIGKYVEKLMKTESTGQQMTLTFLEENGF